jgi:hypothetical protein
MSSRKNATFLTAAILASALVVAIAANTQLAFAGGKSRTNGIEFDPDNFGNSLDIDKQYFPLVPGTTFTYKGETDGEPTKDVFKVTDQTKEILGVTARVVHDTAYENGEKIEVTDDWFAQDDDGNVWYMGEFTTELETGSHEGSWEAGVDGAEPGIIMLANPEKGDKYYQEFLEGEAEDQAKVIEVDESVCVPYGCFDHVVVTKDFTALERGVTEQKYYAPGIGEIKEELVKGGDETLELTKIRS